ncbi:MAG: hypothetical protein J7M38_10365, partial [Armatimonadetes bacterium]|nr:hypothetical protein [Armatimonadota bacterium]
SLLSPTDQKMVTHEEITQESYTGRGGETGGPAGLTSTGAREVSRSGGSYEHKSEVREYQYSRDVEQISKPPGQLQRLTVAVAVDDQLEAGAEEKVRELVTAAAGINPERGDQVTVQSIAIDALKRAEEEEKLASSMEAADAHSRSLRIGLRYGSFLVMALMMGAALLMFSRRLSALSLAAPTGGAAGTTTGADDGEEAAIPPMTVEELRRSVEQDKASTEHAGADDTEDTLVAELSSFGAKTPEVFARRLRGWINPDDFEGE